MHKINVLKPALLFLALLAGAWRTEAQVACQNRTLDFDGVNDYVQVNSPLSGNVPFTIELWFKSENTLNGTCTNNSLADFRWLFSWDDNNFGLGDCNGDLRLVYKPLCPLGTGLCSSLQPIPVDDGKWHHVALAKSTTGMKVYVDGVFFTGLDQSVYDVAGFLNLGASGTNNVGRNWDGQIDEMRIWDYARSESQIRAGYLCEPANDLNGLRSWYTFDQGVPVGNNPNETTLINNVTGGPTGKLNGFALTGDVSNWICSESGVDVAPPTLSCGDIRVQVEPEFDGRTVYYDWLSAEGTDVQLQCSPASGSFFKVGNTQVICSATDACGQVAECGFTVTVEKMPYDSAQPPASFSRDGTMDKVRDRFGNPYRLGDLQIPKAMSGSLLCASSGYFNLYFEPGCGMEGSSAAHVARRNVMCQLFSDLSNFIIPANASTKVNIWVRDISLVPGVPPPATSGILGLASSFYVMPQGTVAGTNGIVDGEIWKTINSGVDSYTGVVSPLTVLGGPGGGFYHGIVAFNFVNPFINWHNTLNASTTAGLYDLYSVGLHEAVHALGFASLIRPGGVSAFAPTFPYFSRYDLFLQNAANQPLITNTGACSMYAYQWNSAVPTGVLQPNTSACITNQTTCATAIKFAGTVNQKVYTPNCFESGSSLSHLEDLCHTPLAFLNDQYYVMSNANGTGATYMKRFLKPEERLVLCDIGYKVGTSYGNVGQFTNTTYTGGQCPGLGVAGVNDGITSGGSYAYQTTVSTPITVSNILANDYQAVSFECLQVIVGTGTLSTTSGTSFTFTPTATPGTTLLRYVPVSSSGKRGNITYVFIRVSRAGCPVSPCQLVGDPKFEQALNCGPVSNSSTSTYTAQLFCWDNLSSSPDVFARSACTNSSYIINTGTIPNTWDGLLTNGHYIGLWATNSSGSEDYESSQTTLATPITPGQTYTVKFWARMRNGTTGPTNIRICGSPSTIAYFGGAFTPVLSISGVQTLVPAMTVVNNSAWNQVTATFTYTGSVPLYNLIVANYPGTTTFSGWKYVFLDDLELIPNAAAPSFTPPSPVCQNAAPVSLAGTVLPPGGTFSGPGVSGSNFNPSTAGVGSHTITYTATDANGCTATKTAVIQVVAAPVPTFIAPATPICSNVAAINLTLLVSPGGGTFSGPGVSGTNFNPATAGVGTHTLTYSIGGACPASITANFQVVNCVDVCEITNLCLDFDGVNDYVQANSPITTLPPGFSVGCWFKNDRTAGADFFRLFAWAGVDRFELGDKNGFLAFYSNRTGGAEIVSTTNIRDARWHHVVAVKAPVTHAVTVFLDGSPVVGLTNLLPTSGTYTNLGSIFRLGDWAGGNVLVPRFWQGRIDEFKVWNTTLTQAQVWDEMACASDLTNVNLLLHFPMDQNTSCANNAGNVTVNDVMPAAGTTNGTMSNFALNGCTSNWVDRGRDRLPNCSVAPCDWLEGNPRRNISGRTKVYDTHIFTAGLEYVVTPNTPNGVNYPTFTRRRPDCSIAWRTIINVQGVINDFIRTDEGCYLLVGHTPAFQGDNRSFIARIDQNGQLDWLHTYNLGERESFNQIIRSDNPSNPLFPYTVCGIRKNAGTSADDILLFTLDNQGGIGWMRQIGNIPPVTDDEFRMDLMNQAGGYALAGLWVNGTVRSVIFRTNNLGVQLASPEYAAGEVFNDVEPASGANGLIVVGRTGTGQGLIARLNATTGAQIWARSFPQINTFRRVIVKPNGDIYALGQFLPTAPYRNVIVKLRDNPTGVAVQWLKGDSWQFPSEINWTPADLTLYSKTMFFFGDSRINHPNQFGNEDIAAVMYDLEQTPDVCPFVAKTPQSQPFTLTPAQMPTLVNTLFTPNPPVITSPWSPLGYERRPLCSDSCACEFIKMAFRKKGTTLYVPVGCGNAPPVGLPCPGQYTPVSFTGVFVCKGDDCKYGGLTWTINGPLGPVGSGSVTTLNFSIPITLAMVQTPGVYTILLTGICGGVKCECRIQFKVDQCPKPCDCTQPAYTNAVFQGFNFVQLPGCKFNFTPKALTECDKVQWKVAKASDLIFTFFASSTGNATVSHTFTASDQYVVCYTVTRTPPGGTSCPPISRCWNFDVDCSLLAKPGENLGDNRLGGGPCNGSVVQNDGFTIGAEAGGLTESGTIWNWEAATGNPEVVLEPGKLDPNFIRLQGNGGHADQLYQDSMNIAKGKRIQVTLAFRPVAGLVLPGTDLVVRLSTVKPDSLYCLDENTCREILRASVPDDSTGGVWYLASSFDSTVFAGKYLTVHVENPFADDDVALKSVVDVDNVCLREFNSVDVKNVGTGKETGIRVWPNPNRGEFTVELPENTSGKGRTLLRLTDLAGRTVFEKTLDPGARQETLDVGQLPEGLYLLRVIRDGRTIGFEKIVKQ